MWVMCLSGNIIKICELLMSQALIPAGSDGGLRTGEPGKLDNGL